MINQFVRSSAELPDCSDVLADRKDLMLASTSVCFLIKNRAKTIWRNGVLYENKLEDHAGRHDIGWHYAVHSGSQPPRNGGTGCPA